MTARRALILALALGIPAGLGAFTFRYAEGLSYFSSDPQACMNCHIMRDQYDSWAKSGHHHVAVCNDCHLPHSLIPKLIAKSRNGWNHSSAFTLQNFPEPIMIGRPNAAILEGNCRRCHEALVHGILMPRTASGTAPDDVLCVRCHKAVGHAPTRPTVPMSWIGQGHE
jgi:cytochrome c nitrite reductase small subunit